MDLSRPVRTLVRRFVRAPAFTALSVGTLALGLGATIAIYAVVESVLLEPLPYPESDRLVGIWHEAPGLNLDEVEQSPALHFAYLDESRVFEDIGMYSRSRETVTGLGEPEQVGAVYLTDGMLRLLGAQPVRGRIFTAEDDAPGAARTVMVSERYWRQRLAADPGVLGRILTVNGRPREIIGVLPEGFQVLDRSAELYVPLQLDRAHAIVGNFSYLGVARLRPNTTIEQANADLARIIPLAPERYPGGVTLSMLEEARMAPTLRPLAADVVGDIGGTLWVLMGTVVIVLLIAGANVANLFLVRAEGRYREVAVRSALGASRARIAGEFMAESLSLALIGGALGTGLAMAGIRLLKSIAPSQLPRLEEISADGSVLAVAFALTLLTGALLGLVPILRHGGDRIAGTLREAGRGGGAGRERHRARSALVVGQIALALLLLASSGLMIRSALELRRVDPGFQAPADLLTLQLAIPSADVPEPLDVAGMHERIMRGLEAVPGVEAVATTSSLPMSGYNSNDPIDIEEAPVPSGQLAPIRRYAWVSPGYFETMGVPVVAGRTYTWDDMRTRPAAVVISESLARIHWSSPSEAIGKRVRNIEDRPWREIIGVVADVRTDGLDRDVVPTAYWPMLMSSLWEGDELQAPRSMGYVLRLRTAPTAAFMEAVRGAVWAVNPNLPLADVQMMDEVVEASMARTSFALVMLGIAAAVALLLGAVGLYGVVSYAVAQRTREFGVRMALGAQRTDVGSLVLGHAGILIGIGVTLGLGASLALTRMMSAMLFGVAPSDPLTLAAVSLTLAAVALLASAVPVLRATRVDPLDALRAE